MTNPQLGEIKVGDKVQKTVGDYYFQGIVVAVFLKLNKDKVRIVVENPDGILHIFSLMQLEKIA